MSRSFDYQTADVHAIAVRLNTVQKQSYYRLLSYYSGDQAMLEKLAQAHKLSAIYKLQSEYTTAYGVTQ